MSLCKAQCGFYSKDNGYCSTCDIKTADPETDTTSITTLEKKESPTVRNRCQQCKRKVGLLGFECSCSGLFCQKCRHVESHHCSFDHARAGKLQLQKNNPLIIASKLVRIED